MITPAEIHAAHILIVDDREANILLLEGILRREGYQHISRTLDSTQVFELHRLNRYDLILLDLHMPKMDGFEVMANLKSLEKEGYLPVLVVTAQPGHLLRSLRAGARDFISKPFDLAEVLMRVHNLLEVRLLHRALLTYSRQLEVRNQVLKETFGRQLSESSLEQLLALPEILKVGGETHKVTMMVANLMGITSACADLPPNRTAWAVNSYLDKMLEILLDHGGFLDGFTGDGMMALFGAASAQPHDAQRAVACALAMQAAMHEVNVFNRQEGFPLMEMAVGLHTGEVVVGHIASTGSSKRANYGALGSEVNVATRVESCTPAGQTMMSQSTADEVASLVRIGERLVVQPADMGPPIAIYSVLGMAPLGVPQAAAIATNT